MNRLLLYFFAIGGFYVSHASSVEAIENPPIDLFACDDDGDSVLTINEDYNDSGSPLDDDLNTNNIPDFLDSDIVLNTDDFTFNNVTIYPNPATSIITVENIEVDANIIIYDAIGRVVLHHKSANQRSITIDVSIFTKGFYFMRINNKKPLTLIKN